jgi:predicted  nucleic acid-binding Zn-ribbon protein
MILDPNGNPVAMDALESGCPQCGSKKPPETFTRFGGFWSTNCTNCGHEFASGRKEVPNV